MLTDEKVKIFKELQKEFDAYVIAEFAEKRGIDISPDDILKYAEIYRKKLNTSSVYLEERFNIIENDILPAIINNMNETNIFKNFVLSNSLISGMKFNYLSGKEIHYLNLGKSDSNDEITNFIFVEVPKDEWEIYHISRFKNVIKKYPDNEIKFILKKNHKIKEIEIKDIKREEGTIITFI